jgi:tetratricopeptide (TPR) repeat protein
MMVTLHVKSRNFTSAETARDIMPHEIARSFDLTPRQTDSLKGAFDVWCRDVQSLLGSVVEKDSPPHIDEIIVSGWALANMLDAMLELPDLSDTLRSQIMTRGSWSVPRVVQRPIEELEKCITDLRSASQPDEKSLAKCLDGLAAAFEEREDALRAIPALMEAIRIRQRLLGDSWNPNPLRYRLRNQIRKHALEPEQPESLRKLSGEAALLVLELKPDSPTSHQVLGMTRYRLGKHAEAVESLQVADAQHREMYEGGLPVDVAFLAMSHQAMGNTEEAQMALARLRELMKSRAHAAEAENRKVLEEAESLFDEVTPGGPR